jgi:hypothetical protein
MNIMELGALGEFVGAIAVVVTLFYLAVQVRYSREATEANTRSVDESRKLAMAQTYQSRAIASFSAFDIDAEIGGMAPIVVKYNESGIEGLSAEEQERLRLRALARTLWFDNLFYQYEQGYLEPDLYESLRGPITSNAEMWKTLGITMGRPSFRQEVDRLLAARGMDGATK